MFAPHQKFIIFVAILQVYNFICQICVISENFKNTAREIDLGYLYNLLYSLSVMSFTDITNVSLSCIVFLGPLFTNVGLS